jgi:hypothetical protein
MVVAPHRAPPLTGLFFYFITTSLTLLSKKVDRTILIHNRGVQGGTLKPILTKYFETQKNSWEKLRRFIEARAQIASHPAPSHPPRSIFNIQGAGHLRCQVHPSGFSNNRLPRCQYSDCAKIEMLNYINLSTRDMSNQSQTFHIEGVRQLIFECKRQARWGSYRKRATTVSITAIFVSQD